MWSVINKIVFWRGLLVVSRRFGVNCFGAVLDWDKTTNLYIGIVSV